jgi:hemin uptake protein HemP
MRIITIPYRTHSLEPATMYLVRPAAPPVSPSATTRAAAVPRVNSAELLRGSREIVIEHRGEEYRLLRTRNDRLILNK